MLSNINSSSHIEAYVDLLITDAHFATCHHKVAGIASILPTEYAARLQFVDVPFVSETSQATKGNWSWLIRFFRANIDNYVIGIFCILIPTLFLYYIHIYAQQWPENMPTAVFIGHTLYLSIFSALPLAFVALGKDLVANLNTELNRAVSYMINIWDAEKAQRVDTRKLDE